jgi:hypothetical protein
MMRAGVTAEVAAVRLGHSDGGALLRRTYLDTPASEQRKALDGLGVSLLQAQET